MQRRSLAGTTKARDVSWRAAIRVALGNQPSAVAHDQSCEGMADFDMEVKATAFFALVGRADRRQRPRQRQAEKVPAAHHQMQSLILDEQRQTKRKRTEAFAQQPLETPQAFFMRAGEAAPRERAPPHFVA